MKLNSREVYGFGARFRTARRFPSAGAVIVLFVVATVGALIWN